MDGMDLITIGKKGGNLAAAADKVADSRITTNPYLCMSMFFFLTIIDRYRELMFE